MKRYALIVCLGATALAAAPTRRPAIDNITTRDSDGAILINREPFFPIGLYHVSHDPALDSQRLADLEIIARAGFNVIATPLMLRNAGPFLERADRLGVRVLVENNDREGLLAMVRGLRGRSGLLGWQIADDADSGRHTPEQLRDRYATVKAIDGGRLAYISGGFVKRLPPFVTGADVVGMQTYPVPGESLTSTTNVLTAAMAAAAPHHRAIIANCQTFAWEKKRVPTPAEARNMTYQALCAGVKGVIFYTFYDRLNYLPDHKELWRECTALVGELKTLAPVLLDAERHTLKAKQTVEVKAACWRKRGEVYLIVCNTSSSRVHRVTIPLPVSLGSEVRPLFDGTTRGFTFDNGAIGGELQPTEVRVFIATAGS
jgi:hypothetical protein